MRKVLLSFLFVFVLGLNLQAQKMGYLNLESLKCEMPEVNKLQSALKLYRLLLFEQRVVMVKTLQKEYDRAQRLVSGGCLSWRAHQKMIVKFTTMHHELELFEVDMEVKIQTFEAKLMRPILDRIDTALQAVAVKNQFQFIIQKGSPAILYHENTADVSGLVMRELGL
jgi:outer membrane protein